MGDETKYRYYITYSHVDSGLVLHGYKIERYDHPIEDEETILKFVGSLLDEGYHNPVILDWKRIL